MTRRERLEAKQAKREQWAEGRKADAARHWEAGDLREEKSGIPFGQPVLVGHHSERHHRRALERADGHIQKAIESTDMAQHHISKAGGIAHQLESSIFSDDANAVEALTEKRTALEQRRDWMKSANAYYKKAKTLDGWDGPDAIRDEGARNMAAWRGVYGQPFPPYALTNIGATIRAAAKRAAVIPKQNAIREERQAKAEAAGGVGVDYSTDGAYCSVFFSERPSRAILNDLRAAFFSWSGAYASWSGATSRLPASVRAMLPPIPAPITHAEACEQ